MSVSVRPHGQQPSRLLCPRDSLGKNTGLYLTLKDFPINKCFIYLLLHHTYFLLLIFKKVSMLFKFFLHTWIGITMFLILVIGFPPSPPTIFKQNQMFPIIAKDFKVCNRSISLYQMKFHPMSYALFYACLPYHTSPNFPLSLPLLLLFFHLKYQVLFLQKHRWFGSNVTSFEPLSPPPVLCTHSAHLPANLWSTLFLCSLQT